MGPELLVTNSLITKGRVCPNLNVTLSLLETKTKTVWKVNNFKQAFPKGSKGCLTKLKATGLSLAKTC